ncbi:hypothetical protein SAMN06295998_1564 [Primorskyibacter flagellatus]|uniref:Uncharacterized protein n=1 Tax=Primorskyibacter flagellatus TaxID=1387277 RepID=A0A1W2EX72_9RHOB|nr:hypothetical protein SAMN06295998_1564 [Primorskyibacter flagellatus]
MKNLNSGKLRWTAFAARASKGKRTRPRSRSGNEKTDSLKAVTELG